jgi:PKD repeat protein
LAGRVTALGAGSPNVLLHTIGLETSFSAPAPTPTPTPAPPPAVDAAPTASFTASCPAGRSKCSVDASASADDRGIASYTWTFGDGSAAQTTGGPLASHTYRATGTYSITLRVTDTAGQSTTTTRTVTVKRL